MTIEIKIELITSKYRKKIFANKKDVLYRVESTILTGGEFINIFGD